MLPVEITIQSSFRRIGLITLSVLILVVAMDLLAFKYLPREINPAWRLVHQKWQILRDMEKPVDWLILGDSSVNQGVAPAVLYQELGVTSVNLGTFGDMTAVGDAWMLETYINRFGPPSSVIIVHVYDVWHRPFQTAVAAQVPLSITRHGISPSLDLLDRRQRVSLIAKFFTPLYFDDVSIPMIIKPPWRGLERQSDQVMPQKIAEDGFVPVLHAGPERGIPDLESHLELVRDGDFVLSKANADALTRIIELSDRYQFHVYLANSPIYEGLYEDDQFQEYYAKVWSTLSDHVATGALVHPILTGPRTFPAEHMVSVDHLTYEGARIYTKWLAEQVQQSNLGH